jgi:hypothetical protein
LKDLNIGQLEGKIAAVQVGGGRMSFILRAGSRLWSLN